MENIRVRFAPSPTGFLHIGSARTALFNWLFARHYGGKFLLRIEDTDKARSTQESMDVIFESLKWLELDWDEKVVYQSQHAIRHQFMANKLLKEGKAYKCFCTPEELERMRLEAKEKKQPPRYSGLWRDRIDHPEGKPYVVRLKMPREGDTVIEDLVQGTVKVANDQLDDMVLLRADGSPTYMLSVVVDDHDMQITHVIRGDDHLTNAFRQKQLYEALGWQTPEFAHIPLIHGADGAKMSKRHGAVGTEVYQKEGFLPEALNNYLLRLGWGCGDEEIIPRDKAIELFTLDGVGKAAARFDVQKLTNLNGYYLRQMSNDALMQRLSIFLEQLTGSALTDQQKNRVTKGLSGLKERAKTLVDLAQSALFYIKPAQLNSEACENIDANLLSIMHTYLTNEDDYSEDNLHAGFKNLAETHDTKLGLLAKTLRWVLTGSNVSPSLFEVMSVLGKEETLRRIHAAQHGN